MSCGSRSYGLSSTQVAALLAQLQTTSASVTGSNPWSVNTNSHGVVLGASYDAASQSLTVTVTSSPFYVPCNDIWSNIEPYITAAAATPVTAAPASVPEPITAPATQFSGAVVDDTGAVVAGASYNQYGYPVDSAGNPLTSDPPASGATLGSDGQAWVDPTTGQELDASGNPISVSTPVAPVVPTALPSVSAPTATSSSTMPWIIGGLVVAGAAGLLYFSSKSGRTRNISLAFHR